MGSPGYVAPEVAVGDRATPASDLWSLGATLYAAVEGRPPYDYETAMATLAALISKEPDPPRRAGPLRPVLDALLCRDPVRRRLGDPRRGTAARRRVDAAGRRPRRGTAAPLARPAADRSGADPCRRGRGVRRSRSLAPSVAGHRGLLPTIFYDSDSSSGSTGFAPGTDPAGDRGTVPGVRRGLPEPCGALRRDAAGRTASHLQPAAAPCGARRRHHLPRGGQRSHAGTREPPDLHGQGAF